MTPREYPVEPLSDEAWQRIERGVFRELERAGTPWWRQPGWARAAAAAYVVMALSVVVAGLRFFASEQESYASHERTRVLELEGMTVELEARSLLRRVRSEWVLERGAGEFRVARRAQGRPLAVNAGDVRVEVVGTVFRVARAAQSAEVHTLEGLVRVIRAGRSQLVAAGERWPTLHAASPASVQLAPTPNSHQPEPAMALPKPRQNTESLQQRYEQGAALERSDPARALAIYRALAEHTGPWGANALFAKARLELERRMLSDAERDLRAYLRRYPHAPNAADARALLDKLSDEPGAR